MPEPAARRRALFLDRDGVINADKGYVYLPAHIDWIPGALASIRECSRRGYLVIVVTNQSGVARGYYTEEHVHALHRWMQEQVEAGGGRIDAFYYCPHHPDFGGAPYRCDCQCRKPAAGLFERAITEWNIDAAGSLAVGDKQRDLDAGQRAGIPSFRFPGGDLFQFIGPLLPEP